MSRKYSAGIVGATGIAGQQFVAALQHHPWFSIERLAASERSAGKPFGQAFGHSINDPNNWCYPLVWMWGGMEVQKDGRTWGAAGGDADRDR